MSHLLTALETFHADATRRTQAPSCVLNLIASHLAAASRELAGTATYSGIQGEGVARQQERREAWQALQVLFTNRVQYTTNMLVSSACAGSALGSKQLHECMHAIPGVGQAKLRKTHSCACCCRHTEMEAADSYRRSSKKPSMYGDWYDEAHIGSGEDTDTDGWVHAQQGAVKAQSSEWTAIFVPGGSLSLFICLDNGSIIYVGHVGSVLGHSAWLYTLQTSVPADLQ